MFTDPATIETERKEPPFSALDVQFGRLIAKYSDERSDNLVLAASLVSFFRARGHVCLRLDSFCKHPFLPESGMRIEGLSLKSWIAELHKSKVVGQPGEFRPLILDRRNRLYLHRYWKYEEDLAAALRDRLEGVSVNERALRAGLEKFFSGKDQSLNWQKIAAFAALTRKLTVISGGPGTGKTSTILKILALLLEQGEPLRIALAAPTGKAVSRLQETIKSAKQKLDCAPDIKAAIPEEALTIHRLLGVIPDSPFFRHDSKNRLAVDVLVIDEASMIDLALMTKLMSAVPASARVILLGDKDQLSSVEAGSVLADICGYARENRFSAKFHCDYERITGEKLSSRELGAAEGGLSDCIVQLQTNYRFGGDSAIYRASIAVRHGRFSQLETLFSEGTAELRWQPEVRFKEEFKEQIVAGFKACLSASDPATMLTRSNDSRVLAAVREGDMGVLELNRRIERLLRERGLIRQSSEWYDGRPIMITRNDYAVNLYNGDTGVVLRDADGNARAYFLNADNEVRSVLPSRLPQHETVFAMTIHKSQGSEFDHVMIVLPETDRPILTRELIYTGITRARKTVTVLAREHILRTALSREVERTSGLQDKLWSRSGNQAI